MLGGYIGVTVSVLWAVFQTMPEVLGIMLRNLLKHM
jgi:hypothetical protein